MGANEFFTKAKGANVREAFRAAVEEAQYQHGHGGYSGTLAEKHTFQVIIVPKGKDPTAYAEELVAKDDHRIADKWGPAGAIKLGDGEWLFFGLASS